MTEQELLEQAAKPQRWGSKERVKLVAEVLRQKRIARWLAEYLAEADDETTPEEWLREAEQATAENQGRQIREAVSRGPVPAG